MRRIAFIGAAALLVMTASSAKADLVITGVVDGNESGGNPKGVELFALADIADLSIYGIQRYTNGGSTASSPTVLPSISLAAGDFFYITGNAASTTIFTDNGFTVGLINETVVNINGDDLLQVYLTSDNSAVDTFGLPGQGDTNFYENSIAYRLASSITPNPTGGTDAPNFAITGWVDSADFAGRFGTFSASAIPEPGSFAILGLAAVGVVARRRAKAAKIAA